MLDIFSKRQKCARGEFPDVFQYTDIPVKLRAQIVHIISDGLGGVSEAYRQEEWYKAIHDLLCREYGLFNLPISSQQRPIPSSYKEKVFSFFLSCPDHEQVLDVVEIAFRHIEARETYGYNPVLKPEEAIQELNQRFLEHGVGYQYENREMIRTDSQLIHTEVVKPALRVLTDPIYQGANDEYLSAHKHYRQGKYKECLSDCLKSFESTMKAICEKRGWAYDKDKDTAKKLIDICFANGLIPPSLQSQFSPLRASLECGIPTPRNRLAGHGQGHQPTQIPSYIAGYLLHLTATTILMLEEAEKEMR